jgi:glyoxylase-like metal-dependent hydrolase (beta-lactamase superfamily II)
MSEVGRDDRVPVDGFPRFEGRFGTGAELRMKVGDREAIGVSDGFFDMGKVSRYVGTAADPTAGRDLLRVEHGIAVLPVGSFLIPGEETVLIDPGVGPVDYRGLGALVGGNLIRALGRFGVTPADVDLLALTHLHVDHVGWLATAEGRPVFPNARVAVGRADWDHFVEGEPEEPLAPHVLAGLRELASQGRVDLLDNDLDLAPGFRRIATPGHTPGHSIYALEDGGERLLFLGDAVYFPQQLFHPDWVAESDVDKARAQRTREALLRDLEASGSGGVGAHFPALTAGRMLDGEWCAHDRNDTTSSDSHRKGAR